MYEVGTYVYCYYKVGFYEKIRFGKVLEYAKTSEGEFYNVLIDGTACLLPVDYVNTDVHLLIDHIGTQLKLEYLTRITALKQSAIDFLEQHICNQEKLEIILKTFQK